jgi:hypothetical protein
LSRIRADFWVSAYLRRHSQFGRICVVSRRGDAQAGAVWVEVDHLDGTASLFGPTPSIAAALTGERLFAVRCARLKAQEVQARITQEARYDPDFWLITLEEPAGDHLLELAPER